MDPVNLFEYEALARARMERTAWDYYQSGAEDEVTLREPRGVRTDPAAPAHADRRWRL